MTLMVANGAHRAGQPPAPPKPPPRPTPGAASKSATVGSRIVMATYSSQYTEFAAPVWVNVIVSRGGHIAVVKAACCTRRLF